MALLNLPQVRPFHLWPIIHLLQEEENHQFSQAELKQWLTPTATEQNTLKEVTEVLRELGFLDKDKDPVTLLEHSQCESLEEFLDALHDSLIHATGPNRRLMQAFAVLVVACNQHRGVEWLTNMGNQTAYATFIAKGLPSEGKEREGSAMFNDTKLSAWIDYMDALGMGWNNANVFGCHLFPSLTERLERTLMACLADGELEEDKQISAEAFLAILQKRMPYLDGGEMAQEVAKVMGTPPMLPDRTLGYVLSSALRDLREDGLLHFHREGDKGNPWRLWPEDGIYDYFDKVKLMSPEVQS